MNAFVTGKDDYCLYQRSDTKQVNDTKRIREGQKDFTVKRHNYLGSNERITPMDPKYVVG